MNYCRARLAISKVFVHECTTTELEDFFECKLPDILEELKGFYSTQSSPEEKLSDFLQQLETNNARI